MNLDRIYGWFLPLFRRRRMKHFLRTFDPRLETRILDVGGGVLNWELIGCDSHITILNLSDPPAPSSSQSHFTFVRGDGRSLQYPDNAFDIVFSNSVIEHLSSWENQVRFAQEIRRVSGNVWVQTPARSFFLEPHLLTPFIHFVSRRWQKLLLRNFTVWGLITRPSPSQIDHFLDEVRLLSFDEMRTLFPDCTIFREKFLWLTKAYIAIKRGAAIPSRNAQPA